MRHIFSAVVFCTILGTSLVSQANPSDLLNCTPEGDALDSVNVGIDMAGSPDYTLFVEVRYQSGENPAEFTMSITKKEYDLQAKSGQFEIVGRSADSGDFGGGVSKAILMTVNTKDNKQVTAVLSMDGFVYQLKCNPFN